MSILSARVLETLAYPPAGPLLLMLLALLLRRHRRTGWTLAVVGWTTLYLGATPAVSLMLLAPLESEPALTAERIEGSRAQAIVVISGGRYSDAPEYGGDTSSASELERLRYAAYLQRRTGLPLAVSGGDPLDEGRPAAVHMKEILEGEFGVPVRWAEERSRTTFENARYTWALLAPRGVSRIFLVTHAWHMGRAKGVFEQQGFAVTAAPTGFSTRGAMERGALAWLPDAEALSDTRGALHEWLGRLWYALFHGAAGTNAPSITPTAR